MNMNIAWVPVRQDTLASLLQMRRNSETLGDLFCRLIESECRFSDKTKGEPIAVEATSCKQIGCNLAHLAKKVFGYPHVKRRCWMDIIIALAEIPPGFSAQRLKVIDSVGSMRTSRGEELPSTFGATVQRSFQDYCGEADNFNRGRARDFFCFPNGKGSGIWGLNVETVENFLTDFDSKNRPLSLDDF